MIFCGAAIRDGTPFFMERFISPHGDYQIDNVSELKKYLLYENDTNQILNKIRENEKENTDGNQT